jgi:cob(I)alamin adenosyltransferase
MPHFKIAVPEENGLARCAVLISDFASRLGGHPRMVKLTKIYTRGGDSGQTSLGDGTRVAKNHLRVAAYGAVDEANSAIGLARLHTTGLDDESLARIQNDLFDIGADFCVPASAKRKKDPLRVTDEQVAWLESEIDRMNDELALLESFVLPGGSPASAFLHLARTIVRRAERVAVELNGEPGAEINEAALRYLNRLSDYLFVMSRYLNNRGQADVLWRPGANRM